MTTTNVYQKTAKLANDQAVSYGCIGSTSFGDGTYYAGLNGNSCKKDATGHGTAVFASMKIVGYTAAEFGTAATQNLFRKGVATEALINADDVVIGKITYTGAGIELEFSMNARTMHAVAELKKNLGTSKPTPADLTKALISYGLTKVTSSEFLMSPEVDTEVFATLELVGTTKAKLSVTATETKLKAGLADAIDLPVAELTIVDYVDRADKLAVNVVVSGKVDDGKDLAESTNALTLVTGAKLLLSLQKTAFKIDGLTAVNWKQYPAHGMDVNVALTIAGYDKTVNVVLLKKAFISLGQAGFFEDTDIIIISRTDTATATATAKSVDVVASVKFMSSVNLNLLDDLTTTAAQMKTKFVTAGLTLCTAVILPTLGHFDIVPLASSSAIKPTAKLSTTITSTTVVPVTVATVKTTTPAKPTPAKPVKVISVTSFATIDGYTVTTFTAAMKTAFIKGIATLFKALVADVTITTVTAGATGKIKIAYSIKVKDAAAQTSMSALIVAATNVQLQAALKTGGLTLVTTATKTETRPSTVVVTVKPVETTPSPPPPPGPTSATLKVFTVTSFATIDGYTVATFTAAPKYFFVKGIATVFTALVADVTITTVTAGATGKIKIDYSIKVKDVAAQASMSALMVAATNVQLQAALKTGGLALVTTVEKDTKAPTKTTTDKPVLTVDAPPPPAGPTPATSKVFTVTSFATIDGYTVATFTAAPKYFFIKGIATIFKALVADVTITTVTAGATGKIKIDYSIKVKDVAAQASMSALMVAATNVQLQAALKTGGLALVTTVEKDTEAPTKTTTNKPVLTVDASGARSAKSLISSLFAVFGVIASLA